MQQQQLKQQHGNTKDSSSSTIILDSLPYVEFLHEDYEEYALAMIEEEMKSIKPRPLRKIPPLKFRTTILQKEYDALSSNNNNNNNNNRNSSKEGNPYQPCKIVQPTSIDEWKSHAIPLIKSRFEAERIRSLILEVEKDEAVQNWKDYNVALDGLKSYWMKALQEQAEAVEEVNFQRQQAQTQHLGPEIDRLNQEYQRALYKRNELEYAIEGLRRRQQQQQQQQSNKKRKADETK
jgi:hypothetical protein